jgi:hypothetical protein
MNEIKTIEMATTEPQEREVTEEIVELGQASQKTRGLIGLIYEPSILPRRLF